MDEMKAFAIELAKKAKDVADPTQALHLSQASLNVTQAYSNLKSIEISINTR